MELYVGGYSQGKLEYVKSNNPKALVYDENNFEKVLSTGTDKVILNNFHLCVKRLLDGGQTPIEIKALFTPIFTKENIIIICDEIGNGIIPMEEADRVYRECTGRLLCEIAKNAEKVVRIVCGIAQQIK